MTSPKRLASSLAAELFSTVSGVLDCSPVLRLAFRVLAVLHPVYQLLVWLPMQWCQTSTMRDVIVYFDTAVNVVRHQPLYHPLPSFGPDGHGTPYLYPPQFALLLAPLGRLSFHDFCVIWYVVLVLGFWVFAWTLDRLAAARATVMGTLLWGLALAAMPGAYEAMSEGQIDPVVWALFGLALAVRFRGFSLGILTHVKLFGLFPILMAFRSEGRRVTIPAVLTVAVGFIIGVLAFGPASLVHWVKWALPIPSQGYFSEDNLSLSFLMLRIGLVLGLWKYHGGPLPFLPHLFLQVCQVLGIVWAFWVTRAMSTPKNYVVALLMILLFSPTCWYTYAPLAFALVALSLKEHSSAPARTCSDPAPV